MSQICDHDIRALVLFLPNNIIQLGSGHTYFHIYRTKERNKSEPFPNMLAGASSRQEGYKKNNNLCHRSQMLHDQIHIF